MNTKEPFFVDDVTNKIRLACTPTALKIPVSEEVHFVKDFVPNVPALFRSRRPSMEPYYQAGSRPSFNASTLSSYAKLSDIFDYHYLALSELVGATSEIAVVSDSESEAEDEGEVYCKERFNNTQIRRTTTGTIAPEADLKDKLHFLTFQHNSRKATVPSKPDSSTISDHFGELDDTSQYDAFSVAKHRRVSAPRYVCKAVEPLDTPSNVQLLEYLTKCSNPLNSVGAFQVDSKAVAPKPSIGKLRASDCYEGAPQKAFLLDAETFKKPFLI